MFSSSIILSMRTLTELQAFDATLRWVRMHIESMGDPPLHDLETMMSYGRLNTDGTPDTNDPGEWQEWTECVTATIEAERARRSNTQGPASRSQ